MQNLFFKHKVFKHISKTLITLISILQAVKSVIKNTGKKPCPNTGFYGPHVDQSECRILQSHIINRRIWYYLHTQIHVRLACLFYIQEQ